MKPWLILLALLIPTSLPAAETIPFDHWTVLSRADPATGEITLAAYTRNQEGHLLAIGQKDNGPIDGALMLSGASGLRAQTGQALELSLSSGSRFQAEGLRIPRGASSDNPSDASDRVEWQIWDKRVGGSLPALIEALRQGQALEVAYRDEQGERRQTGFSLKGADRALAWVLQEGPMTASYHTVDTLSEEAAQMCRRNANGDAGRMDACFDGIVTCWDKRGSGSVAAFRGCLRTEGAL